MKKRMARLLTVVLAATGCQVRTAEDQRREGPPPRIATPQSSAQEAMGEAVKTGLTTAFGGNKPAQGPADPNSGLEQDRPFPENGMAQIAFHIADDQPLSQVTAYNRSQENVILLWFYNFGSGDKEAARLHLRAGQSGRMVLPTYEYRLAAYSAPVNLGMTRGFGSDAKLRDFGFVDMKTPTNMLVEAATFDYYGFGNGIYKPGKLPK